MSIPKVLLVDDEANVLTSCKRVLRKEGFEVVTTVSPEEALRFISEEPYAMILSDQRMPEMEGTELLEKVRDISPDTVRIILTGYADIQAAIEAINRGAVYRFLTKPWNDEELRLTVRQAVAQFELVAENKRLNELTQRQNAELKEFNQNLEKKVEERTEQIAGLNRKLKKGFICTVQVMAGLAEMHSDTIGSHSKRVANLCKEVGRALSLGEDELFQIVVAATLHDIGKIGLPPDILTKPEHSLKPREKKLLRGHVVKGETMLRMVPNLTQAALFVRHHHERYEEAGYPDRLQGNNIPLGARIIAAVDAYDKALNTRHLFASATPEKALKFVQSRCPAWFDPSVVSALTACLSDEDRVRQDSVEIEIRFDDLKPGMTLSRDLRSARGVMLLPKDTQIQGKQIAHLQAYQESDPIVDGIYVYRKNPVSTLNPTSPGLHNAQ